MTLHTLRDLEAFCATCPAPEEVTQGLRAPGFELTFQMDMIPTSRLTETPALPAQYHYSDGFGTELIYLAGRDADLDREGLPAHASRFWLFPGGCADAYLQALSLLARSFRLRWRPAEAIPSADHQVA
jgi:hypothetical protein